MRVQRAESQRVRSLLRGQERQKHTPPSVFFYYSLYSLTRTKVQTLTPFALRRQDKGTEAMLLLALPLPQSTAPPPLALPLRLQTKAKEQRYREVLASVFVLLY